MKFTLKRWLYKKLEQEHGPGPQSSCAYYDDDVEIVTKMVGESLKAYLIKWDRQEIWVPKSMVSKG